MPYLEREAARVFYETWGEGEKGWITLVNGHTRSHTDFRAFGRYLAERGWRVLAPDNRGSGKTESAPDFSLSDIVDDIGALWDAERITRSHLLGISFGGAISMSLAHAHGLRIGGLELVSTASTFPFARDGKKPEMARYFSARFAATNPLLYRALTRETGNAYSDPALLEGAKAQHRALAGFDANGWLARITNRTLVVHGDEDAIIDPKEARHLAEKIPDARLVFIPGAGHLLLAEAPRKLYEVSEEFFGTVG